MSTPDVALRLPDCFVSRVQIRSLTGLRFFAALHVVVFHLILVFKSDFGTLPAWAQNVANCGYLGVPLFFLLSGFVMAITYLDAPPGARPQIDPWRYWVARFARIYPVYALSLLLAAPFFIEQKLSGPVALPGAAKTALNMLLHGALLQSWIPRLAMDWNPPAWSLSVEAFFYAAFPFIAMSAGLPKLDRKGLIRAAIATWATSLAITLLFLVAPRVAPGLDGVQLAYARCFFPLLRLPDFLLGILVGRLFLLRGQGVPPAAMTLGLAIAILAAMGLVTESIDHNLVSSLMLLPFAVFLFGLAHQSGGLSAWLGRPGMVLFGEASYSVYILHAPLLYFLSRALSLAPNLPVVSRPFFYVPAYLLVTLGLSILVFRRLEVPLRERIKRALS